MRRLSAPLLDIALAMIALAGVLVGEFSRRRLRAADHRLQLVALQWCALAAIAISAAAVDDPQLNALQYALPVAVALVRGLVACRDGDRGDGGAELGPSVLAEA